MFVCIANCVPKCVYLVLLGYSEIVKDIAYKFIDVGAEVYFADADPGTAA